MFLFASRWLSLVLLEILQFRFDDLFIFSINENKDNAKIIVNYGLKISEYQLVFFSNLIFIKAIPPVRKTIIEFATVMGKSCFIMP